MARSLKESLRKILIPRQILRDSEHARFATGQVLARVDRLLPAGAFNDHEFQVYSQWGEDGLLQYLTRVVPIQFTTFIEFGVEDFQESNCRFLMTHDNWRGFVLDGSDAHMQALAKRDWFWKYDLRSRAAFITRENVNDLLSMSGFDSDLGVLSVDVDGVDYWLFEAIHVMRPRILVIEYNADFGATRAITVPYDATFSRRAKHFSDIYFGSSLGALTHLANARGYALVGTNRAGVNAFFVRRDVLPSSLPERSVADAYHPAKFRQARSKDGKLSFADAEERTGAIKGMPVVNVRTGATEPF